MIYLNNEPINVTIFPDKTSQVWKIKDIENLNSANVKWEFESESEFIHLAQLKELLDYYNLEFVTLQITYLPYARQDKPVSNNTTFALKTFSKLLNRLNFNKIIINDAHSIKYLLIKNSLSNIETSISQHNFLVKNLNIDLICYPDHNAYMKYNNSNIEFIYAEKIRDPSTGEILSHILFNSNQLNLKNNKKTLIIDDICDGGYTFISLARLLKEQGVTDINLFVTHGIFSNGLKILHDSGIKRIFTIKGEAFEQRQSKQIYYKRIL